MSGSGTPMPKQKPLVTRLRSARILLREWCRSRFDCEKEHSGTTCGKRMALEQIQIDGDAARVEVRQAWPAATSTYVSATAAEVYDSATGVILGRAESREFAVEHAWVKAAQILHELERFDAADAALAEAIKLTRGVKRC